eukprot:TRINITY_DN2267_c0_g1_i2.p1 TRINITY_DN2267_c0_g1~~TRINITY_DN2267_c0_g1_i2.p1  ORF type:complete len:103 (-),score=9.72 TRINITY_DN2267_c0_g1_i2:4-312(-)
MDSVLKDSLPGLNASLTGQSGVAVTDKHGLLLSGTLLHTGHLTGAAEGSVPSSAAGCIKSLTAHAATIHPDTHAPVITIAGNSKCGLCAWGVTCFPQDHHRL